jgi:cell division protein FtsX
MITSPLAKALNLPRTRLFRTLGLLAALLGFMVAGLAASGGLLQQLYSNWQLQKSQSIMLYLPPATAAEALAPLTNGNNFVGIASARVLAPAELQATLASILPTGSNLPLPVVAEVTLQPGADRLAVATTLQGQFLLAEIDDQQPMLQAVASSVRGVQLGVLGLACLLGAILTLFMALTIRAGLLAQSGVVTLLIQLGATDATLARTLTVQAVKPVLLGTLCGTAVALALLGVVGSLWGGLSAVVGVWLWAALLPFTLPLLAGFTAWLVALRLLKHA